MRILHTADWHIGKAWKGVDRLPDLMDHIIPEIIGIALGEKVNLLIIAGDIFDGFDRKSLDLCTKLLREPLKTLLTAGVHVAMIPGNHDNWPMFQLLDAALKINPVSDKAQLLIFTSPMVYPLNEVQIMGMPYLALGMCQA
jgi:DNA repair exonuclease SbcCD nuclease subunit